jgi:hypothetical protein
MIQEAMLEYKQQLQNYKLITHENITTMTKGGYVKYINNNFELKYGGIIVGFYHKGQKIPKVTSTTMLTELVLLVKNNIGLQRINFSKNYIFYMNHRTTNEKLRTIFLKAIQED